MPSSPLTEHLRDLVQEASEPLPRTSWRRMFGCDAAFANGNIFVLIWKTGRVGIKLPDPARYSALMAQEGADPWTPGRSVMSGWVLAPEALHDDPDALAPWVREAHAAALAAGPKVKPGPGKRPGAKKEPAPKVKVGAEKKPVAKKVPAQNVKRPARKKAPVKHRR